jgi:hypothetical protein
VRHPVPRNCAISFDARNGTAKVRRQPQQAAEKLLEKRKKCQGTTKGRVEYK